MRKFLHSGNPTFYGKTVGLSMTNDYSKKKRHSLVLVKWLGWWFLLSNLKLEGVEADEFKGWRSKCWYRASVCCWCFFFLSWCFYGRSADLNKFSWVIYKTICISNNFRDSKGGNNHQSVATCCIKMLFTCCIYVKCCIRLLAEFSSVKKQMFVLLLFFDK